MTHTEPIYDLQTAIDDAPVRGGDILLPGGCYSGDATVPPGITLHFCGPTDISGSVTIPEGSAVWAARLTLWASGNRSAAMLHKADGTTILNARL